MTRDEVKALVLERARCHGLVHGQLAVDLLPWGGPAEAADLLAEMVREGNLRPAAKDLAGASRSVLAFRGLMGLRETEPQRYPRPEDWLEGMPREASDAHLWTFEAAGCRTR